MQQHNGATSKSRIRLPNPRWLPIAAVALALWAAGLGLWYRRLNAPAPQATLPPIAAATSLPPAHPTPTVVTTPPAEDAPVLTAVTRQPNASVSQQDWPALADSFDVDQARAFIAELASDRYAGRAVGSAGGRLAAEWIAQRFAEYGLQPAGMDGSYFQPFPVPYGELTAMPSLERIDASGQVVSSYRFREDYGLVLGGYADGGRAEGPVLWLSNGAAEDYAGLDATGAIVLCRYAPLTEQALRQALEHGARAVLFARTDRPDFHLRRLVREDALLPQGIPALYVGERVITELLAGSGLSLEDLAILHKPRALAARVRLDLPFSYEQGKTGQNVLGILPGSDPDGRDQWVIIGAHYDHLGADPDGTWWGGANDNASGVATLLEIARQWQEQGYVPQRSVLFAAWDGEENGLWGSTYYVEHPRHPLSSTVGKLALDMVGAGSDTLFVDQGGMVADQALAAARVLGVPVLGQSMGRSDHAPFVSAGVPASLFIWWDGMAPGVVYHVPADSPSNIEPPKLHAAGALADMLLLDLSSDQEQVEDLAANMRQAFAAGDVNAVLASLDPQDAALRQQQQNWLSALLGRGASAPQFSSNSAIIERESARSDVTLAYVQDRETTNITVTLPARWVRRNGRWYYAGPAYEQTAGRHVVVQSLPAFTQGDLLASQSDALYERITQDMGLTLPITLSVHAYSDPDTLLALHAPPAGWEGTTAWVQDASLTLGSSTALTSTMLQAALQRAGWPADPSRWLAHGLETHLAAAEPRQLRDLEARFLPLLAQASARGTLASVEHMPDPAALDGEQRKLWTAQAWAMARYLVETRGWSGLRQPSLAGLQNWQEALVEPWLAADRGIASTLAQRSQAVLAQDRAAFLATVVATQTTLWQEEQHWFDDLHAHPADQFSLTGELVALDGDRASVALDMTYHVSESSTVANRVSWRASFVQRDGRWLYADVEHTETRSQHFVFKDAIPGRPEFAHDVLAQAESAYASVSRDLNWQSSRPVEIKYYDDQTVFQASIYLSMIPARGWAEPGEAIKLTLVDADQVGRVLAHELTHMALFDRGVQHSALHEGTAQFEAALVAPQWRDQQLRMWRREVYDLVRSDRQLSFASMTDWREQQQDLRLFYSLGWDTVAYFRTRYGRDSFLRWLDAVGSGLDFEAAFVQATGSPWAQFETDWRASVLRGHLDPQDISVAMCIDAQAALQHVQVLAQPDWGGRQAGTPGARAAAEYIADHFSEYGLQPAGGNGSYLQSFAISQTALLTTPVFTLLDANGQPLRQLRYREEFCELIRGRAGGGQVSAEIVYATSSELGDARLGGRILLTRAESDPMQQASVAFQHGAAGLLLATDLLTTAMPIKSDYLPELQTRTLPVFMLAKGISDELLHLAGYTASQSRNAPTVQLLSLRAALDVQLAVTPTAQASNVLGVLPGSDPQLSDQVLILGAHLDHVGSLPDGTIYSGANDDASGVGVLLEIARLLHESDYHPRRSLLFAAWDAEEQGLLGSKHYVAHPTLPLSNTLAMLQLDMVGGGRGYYLDVSGDELRAAGILASLENAAGQVEGRLNVTPHQGGSDHATFDALGIPAVMLSWEGFGDLHLPGDTLDGIAAHKLGATGRIVTLALITLAND